MYQYSPAPTAYALHYPSAEEKHSQLIELIRPRSGMEIYHKYPCLGCVFWLLFGSTFSARLVQRLVDELTAFHHWKQVITNPNPNPSPHLDP